MGKLYIKFINGINWLYCREKFFIFSIIFISLVVKIPLLLAVGNGNVLTVWGKQHSDVHRYLDQAGTFLEGNPDLNINGRPSRHGPVYPAFIAIVLSVFGREQYDSIRIIQLFLNVFVCVMLYEISRHLFGRKVATYVIGVGVFWLAGFYWSAELLTESLFAFLFVATLYGLIISRQRIIYLAIAGITFGLASQTRVTALPFLPLLSIWVFLGLRQDWKIRIAAVALFLGTFFIIRVPLVDAFENSTSQDHWIRPEIMGKVYTGLNLEPAPPISEEIPRLTRESYYAEETWNTIQSKEFWQRLFYRKIIGFWYPLFNANNGAYYIFDFSFFFIAPFFLLGLWVAPKSAGYWFLVSIFIAVYGIIVLFAYGYPRHRWPADPVVIILGSYGLYHYIRYYLSRPVLRNIFWTYGITSLLLICLSNPLFSFINFIYHGALLM